MARGEVTGKKPMMTGTRARRAMGPPRRADPSAIEPSKHGEPASAAHAKAQSARGPPPPVAPACFTIKTFCIAHDLSEAMFFKMREMGIGPREMRVGTRVLITFEAAADWRAERERAAATAAE
jgi:hypothetical protein